MASGPVPSYCGPGGSSKRKLAGRKAAGAEPRGGDDVTDLVDGNSGEDDVHAGVEPSQPPSVRLPHYQAVNTTATLELACFSNARGLRSEFGWLDLYNGQVAALISSCLPAAPVAVATAAAFAGSRLV